MKKVIRISAIIIILSLLSFIALSSCAHNIQEISKNKTEKNVNISGEMTEAEVTSDNKADEKVPPYSGEVDFKPDCDFWIAEQPEANKMMKYTERITAVVTSAYSENTDKIKFSLICPDGVEEDEEFIGKWDYYGLEVLNSGEWKKVPYSKNTGNYFFDKQHEDAIGYIPVSDINDGGKILELSFDTNNLCAPLVPGYYRILVFMGDGRTVYAGFRVG